jgi:DNA polymerase-3 subunit beta
MELTIQQGDLAYGAGKALATVAAKSPMPLLSCLLLDADKNGLRLVGTDLEVTTVVRVPCAVGAAGRVAVAARHFHEVVRKLPRGPLTLALKGERCEVRYGEGKGWAEFPTQAADEFPKLPELKGDGAVSLAGDALARLLERTSYAASSEETRPVLNGVLLQGAEKVLSLVATDGHRLARATLKGGFGGFSREGIIVPRRALSAVARTAEEATGAVELSVAAGRNQAGFAAQVGEYRVEIISRLLDGPYPNYEQVIPKDNPHELDVARAELMDAVDRASSHADNVTRQVRLALRHDKVQVSSSTEVGAGSEDVAARYQGEDMDVGYNATYLMDILRTMDTERVCFRLRTPLSAGVVEPVGDLPQKGEDLLCLIMPLRLPDLAA